MKKVFVTLLMLMVVVGLFADEKEDTVIIKANVANKNFAAFTKTQIISTDDFCNDLTDSEKKLNSEGKTSFYASARTNSHSLITVKIYATALTKTNDDSTTTSYPLVINGKTYETAISTEATENKTSAKANDDTVVTFSETTGNGLRVFSKKLEISANLAGAEAGDYSAYITMVVEEGSTT